MMDTLQYSTQAMQITKSIDSIQFQYVEPVSKNIFAWMTVYLLCFIALWPLQGKNGSNWDWKSILPNKTTKGTLIHCGGCTHTCGTHKSSLSCPKKKINYGYGRIGITQSNIVKIIKSRGIIGLFISYSFVQSIKYPCTITCCSLVFPNPTNLHLTAIILYPNAHRISEVNSMNISFIG